MRYRERKDTTQDINISPLIDMVFILLIFFMVSTTFQKETEIKIELPEASGNPTEERKELLEIVIDADGHYFIDEQQVVNTELDTLKRAITKYLGEQSDLPVVIEVVDYQDKIDAVLPLIEGMFQGGLITLEKARVINFHQES